MGLSVTWLGQSGLLLEGGGRTVLVDPWLSPHPDRAAPPPILDHWPARIDLVLVTHGHGDHLDLPGLEALAGRTQIQEIAAPYPHLSRIAEALPDISRIGVRPHETLERLDGTVVLPAWHGVSVDDGYDPMIAADGNSPHVGYFFALGGIGIYISGDTLSDPMLIEAVRPLGAAIAFLPVNGRDAGREARGILGNMTAAEAVAFAIAIGAKTLVPLHYDGAIGNTVEIGEVAHAAHGQPLHLILPARSLPFAFDGNTR